LTVFVKPPKNATGGDTVQRLGRAGKRLSCIELRAIREAGSSMALRLLNRKASERFAGRPGSRLKEIEQ